MGRASMNRQESAGTPPTYTVRLPCARCKARQSLPDVVTRIALPDLVQGVPPIARVGTHLSWPAAGLPRLCPFGTDKDVRTIDLIDGAVTRPLVWDVRLTAANAQGEGLSLDACGGM